MTLDFDGTTLILPRTPLAMIRSSILGAALALVAHAAQPGAVQPVAAPMRDLTWGQLNFLHTTDTHGWLGGHLLECVATRRFECLAWS